MPSVCSVVVPQRWFSWSLIHQCRRAAEDPYRTKAFHRDWVKRVRPGNHLEDSAVNWVCWKNWRIYRSNTHQPEMQQKERTQTQDHVNQSSCPCFLMMWSTMCTLLSGHPFLRSAPLKCELIVIIRCNYRIVIASVHHRATLGAEAVYSLYGVNWKRTKRSLSPWSMNWNQTSFQKTESQPIRFIFIGMMLMWW